MPILDIELVQPEGAPPPAASLTQALADAAGRALGTPPGRTWVRLHVLPVSHYAENEASLAADELPVFATVLHARLPEGAELASEIDALSRAVAGCLGRAPQRVHLQYAPAAAGRQAFGGALVR